MINLVRYPACVLAVILMSSCGGKTESDVENAAASAPVATDTQTMAASAISEEHAAALKSYIAKSGGQCADIVGVQGEDLSNKVKVTCTGQAGDASTVSYIIDLETEQAQKDG